MAQRLEIIISAKDEASRVISGFNKNLQSVGKVALGAFGVVGAAAGAAAVGMVKLAADAEPLIGLQAGFAAVSERIGSSSQEMLSSLQDASGGLIANRDLMQSFNQAAALVSDDFAKSLPDAMSLVRRASQATGQDMGFLFDSLVKGVGRVSPMILDNLGIQVQLAEVTDLASEMFGKQASELSKTEQQAALTQIVMEKLGKAYGDVPDITPKFAKIGPLIQNLKDDIGTKLLPVFAPLVEQLLGIAEKAIPVLMEALDSKIIPALLAVSEAFGGFIEGLISGEDPLGDFANLAYNLGMAFGLTQEQATGLYNGVSTLVEGIQNFIATASEVLAPITEWIGEHVELQDVLIALGIAIASVIIPAIISLIATILPIILTFAAVVAAVALLRNAWETNFLGIRDKTQAILEFLQNFIGDFLETIQEWWAEHGEQVIATIQALWDTVSGATSTFVNWMKTTITNFLAAIRQFWADHGEAITAKAQEIWDAVVAIFEFFRDQFNKIFEAFRLALEGDWEGFGEKLREVWDNAWEAIKTVASAAWEFIKTEIANLVDNITSTIRDTDWGAVGRAIIDGIATGIRNGASIIISAAKAAARAAFEAAKGFLGIDSPSRLFADLGQQMMAGMAMGIQQSANIPAAASAAAVSSVANSTVNNWNLTINEAGGVVDPLRSFAIMKALSEA